MPKVVVPKAYRCPITGLLMKKPVFISSEKNNPVYYEQSALELWFQEKKTHPRTNIKLTSLLFNSAAQIKKEIKTFLKKNSVCSEEAFLNAFLTGDVDALEQLNYLDSYALLQLDGQSLLHIAVQNKNLRMVEWLLEQGCKVNLRNGDGNTPIEIALLNDDLAIQQLLIIYGAEHAPLTFPEFEMILDCRVKGRLIITEESELQALIEALSANETLYDLTLQTFSLNQKQLDNVKSIFNNNKTLRRFDIYSEKRSYTKMFQSDIDKNNEKSTGIYLYKAPLEELDIFLSVFFEGREQEPEWVQKKIAELLEFLVFKLPFKELTLSEKEACYNWAIYFLAMESPCEIYRQLINRIMKDYVQFSLKDIHINNPQVLIWPEKSFKAAYLKIQVEYKDYFKSKKIRQVPSDKKWSLKNYQWCANNLINLLREDSVDISFAESCLGASRSRLLVEGFIPLYLKEKQKNSVRFFSKRLNRFRALIEAQEQHFICPISGKIMDFPVETRNGITYERFHIEKWFKENNVDFITKKPLKLNFKYVFPKNELLPKIEAWRKKFGICTHEFFISQLEKGDLNELKKLNYLEYYLHVDLDNGISEFPICIAARHGYWDIVQWLVGQGVEWNVFNTEDERKKTPLDWAFYHGNIEMVQWMIAYLKIDLKLESPAGNKPVWMAAMNEQVEMLDFLLQKELTQVPQENHAAFKSEWIKIQDAQHNTLLHLAMHRSNIEWIKVLVARGIDLDAQNLDGDTVMHLAVQFRHVEVLIYLVDQGAKINIQNIRFETPFIVAQKIKDVELQRFLILHGAEHAYLGEGQLERILEGAGEKATIALTDQDELRALTGMLSSTNLIDLNLIFSLWDEEDKSLLLSGVANNKKLRHLVVTGLGFTIDDAKQLKPYLKNNKIAYEKRCLNPYKNYWGSLAPLFEIPFTSENLKDKKVSEVIAELIHFIAFTLPYKNMDKEYKNRARKACYEWIIYVLFDEPLIEGQLPPYYFHLLKLSFLFLQNKKNPEDYLDHQYDALISRKDLWVWSEKDFKEIYSSFKPCKYLNEINLKAPISIEIYDVVLDQMIDLLNRVKEPLKEQLFRIGKIKEEQTINLLKMGFKPLYLKAQGKNAEIVFDQQLNHWRATVHRINISSEALIYQNERGLLNWELTEHSSPSFGIQNLKNKYGIYYLSEFWKAFEENPWNALLSPNYFENYLFCIDLEGNTLVHIAVRKQDLDLIDYLYEIKCDLDSPNQKGLTSLHLAIENGRMDIFDFLYDRVKMTNEKGSELLHYAFIKSRLEVVQKLIGEGFYLNRSVVDPKGRSLLYLALKNKRQDMLKCLLENWSDIAGEIDEPSIFLAVHHGYIEIISIFIEKGCSFDFQNEEGLTPLHYAIKLGNLKIYLDIAKLLIQQGCDLEIKDRYNKTPLSYAKDLLQSNSKSTFWHLLIRKGVKHNSLNETELRAILSNIEHAVLSISSQQEFMILVQLLKENAFPNLTSLELRLYGNAYERSHLLSALQENRSLIQFSFSENDQDFSKFFKKLIERNRWMAHLKPYEEHLRSIGIKWEEIFSIKELAAKSVPAILAEMLNTKILQLPLEGFDLEDALACYQWVIEILIAEKPIPSVFRPLLEKALNNILAFQKKEYPFFKKHENEWVRWKEWISLTNVWIWSEIECQQVYKALQDKCIQLNIPPYANYQNAIRLFVDLDNYGKCNLELTECLGEDRIKLLRLKFIPMLSPENKLIALENIQQYHELIKLDWLSNRVENTFPNLFKHFNLICTGSDFLAQPLNHRFAFIPKPMLVLYKVASIISYEDYWKGKNKNKLSKGIQQFKDICLDLHDLERDIIVPEYLDNLKKTAITCLSKDAEIVLIGFKFFPVLRDGELLKLYQYLADLDLDNPDIRALDEILENIWREVLDDQEILNLKNGIKIDF